MNHTHLTLEEQERAAYISGDTRTAELIEMAQRLDDLENETGQFAEDIPAMVEAVNDAGGLERLAEKLEDLDHYKQFFEDCFEMLAAHYPCPEVTSDHDRQVIFDAICKGEGLGDE